VTLKLRKPSEVPVEDGRVPRVPEAIPLEPLAISGLCVTKDALIAALRVYVPALVDLEVVEDGARFLLSLGPAGNTGAPDEPDPDLS